MLSTDHIAPDQDASDQRDSGLGVFAPYRMVDVMSEKPMEWSRDTNKDGHEVYGYKTR